MSEIFTFEAPKPNLHEEGNKTLDVRLDKWLWAARFYKTRTLARQAIEGGKIHYNQNRVKPSHSVEEGAVVQIQQGYVRRTVIVKGLSKQRRCAQEAMELFEETEETTSQ